MSLFEFLSRKKRVSGDIGYFGLEDWWFSAFSEAERRYVQQRYQPLGFSGNSLTSGDITYSSQSVINFLSGLAGWFGKKEDRHIAYRILEKAEELSKTKKRTLDLHFLYGEKLALYYKDRDDPTCLEKATEACRQQISLADAAASAFRTELKWDVLPSHKGYEQLSIISKRHHSPFAAALSLPWPCQFPIPSSEAI